MLSQQNSEQKRLYRVCAHDSVRNPYYSKNLLDLVRVLALWGFQSWFPLVSMRCTYESLAFPTRPTQSARSSKGCLPNCGESVNYLKAMDPWSCETSRARI